MSGVYTGRVSTILGVMGWEPGDIVSIEIEISRILFRPLTDAERDYWSDSEPTERIVEIQFEDAPR